MKRTKQSTFAKRERQERSTGFAPVGGEEMNKPITSGGANHTPGPWVAHIGRKPYAVGPVGIDPTSQLKNPLGHVFRAHVRGHEDEQLANAHLIAAAPAMYEALKTTLAYFMRSNQSHAPEVRVIRAALAQAEGKQ